MYVCTYIYIYIYIYASNICMPFYVCMHMCICTRYVYLFTHTYIQNITNQVCMVGLDLLLGLTCCAYLLINSRSVLRSIDVLSLYHTRLLLQAVRWIMGVPAGLKLNDNLDYCLGNLCILGIQCYQVRVIYTRMYVCMREQVYEP